MSDFVLWDCPKCSGISTVLLHGDPRGIRGKCDKCQAMVRVADIRVELLNRRENDDE
jgi:hypothetical protein